MGRPTIRCGSELPFAAARRGHEQPFDAAAVLMQALKVVANGSGFDVKREQAEEAPVTLRRCTRAGLADRQGDAGRLQDLRVEKRWIVPDQVGNNRINVRLRPDADLSVLS